MLRNRGGSVNHFPFFTLEGNMANILLIIVAVAASAYVVWALVTEKPPEETDESGEKD